MNVRVVSALLLIATAGIARADEAPDPWTALRFLVGQWDGHETGRAGIGVGDRTYRFVLGDQYLHGDNTSTFEPQQRNPTGEVHRDWTIFSYDAGRELFVIRQFNSEGFVNTFVLDPEASTDTHLVFESVSSENAPPGLRARLTYDVVSVDAFDETFELALPDEDFERYLQNHWTRHEP